MDEKNVFLTAKAAVAAAAAGFTAAFGWMGWLVVAWCFCMAADYVTGSCVAMRRGEWSSAKARDGLWHKAGMIFAVIAAGVLDLVVGLMLANLPTGALPWEYSVLVCPLVVCWYILTELGSMVENAVALGAPAPPFLAKAIEALKGAVENGDDASASNADK